MPGEKLSQEQLDIKESLWKKAWDQNFNKLENTLKDKIPVDEQKYNKFLNIFTIIKEKKNFTEDEICNFIENANINLINRQLLSNTKEDSNKIVLERIDIFFNKTIKANETTELNNNKNTNLINNNTEVIDNNTEVIELQKQRKATQDSYVNLAPQYKVTDAQLQKEKTNIPQNIINQITEKIKGTDLKADDYFKFYLTAKNNKNELQWTEFDKNFKELNNTLGIAPEMTSMKRNMDAGHTNIIVESNENLKNYADTSDKFNKISAPTLPETKDFDKEFEMYVKFIPDEKTRKNIEDNKDLIKKFKPETENKEKPQDEKWKAAYDQYTKALADVKENLPKRTEAIIKQRVLGSCITGLAKYFDTTTINQDNFADNFDINTQKWFDIENDVLTIKGDIKGNNVGFYYNLTNPEAQLQSDDFLHFDGTSESFAFGVEGGGKNNLWVKLPTLSILSAQAQGVSEKNFTTLLEKSSSIEDFEASMKKQVSSELLKNYGQEALVKTRVERDIEKNITAQTLNSTFMPEAILAEMNRDKSINKTTEKKARKLLKIRDKSTENMRSDELRNFRSLTERLDPLIARKDQGDLEPKRQKLLKGIEEEKWAVNYNDQRWSNTLKFFKRFSKNNQMNMQDLNVFITSLEKKQSIAENITKLSPDFQTAEDHKNADGLLEEIA